MSTEYAWRRRFIEVIEEVFRELHFDAPAMTHDVDASLVMELEVDGTTFEVVHNPRANETHCLIEGRIGHIASDNPNAVLTMLLAKNLGMAKIYSGVFSCDIKDDSVLYSIAMELEEASGGALLQALREIAAHAYEWRLMLSGAIKNQDGAIAYVSSALA
ncbi:CesT family type III secretion system chaperone [Noviherbaspirillum suwonense]|uniref:Tir chaperone protein (CesT) family protein n=1 Tax=Noviherbaspirillum suwonense TaxID=1224511 RepID=A0ABY1PSX1_9BURK|nr:CesT family type III secretion system chaperone [Noviherbaspirillum suwonense]SMP44981.1 Tir chaperone protein (CesT) family protein [Noviherbaspirillum suwonense]